MIVRHLKVKAAIFDIDGLLLDTESLWNEADILLLKRKGINLSKEKADKLHTEVLGTGSKTTMKIFKDIFHLSEDVEILIAERIETVNKIISSNLRLMAGAREIISLFDQMKIVMAVATGGHTRKNLIKYLEQLEILAKFKVLVTLDEVQVGKPDPAIFLYAAEKLQVNPLDCLVLEDAPSGIESGKKAGMHTFGVNSSLVILKQLKESGADQIFTSLEKVRPEDIP